MDRARELRPLLERDQWVLRLTGKEVEGATMPATLLLNGQGYVRATECALCNNWVDTNQLEAHMNSAHPQESLPL